MHILVYVTESAITVRSVYSIAASITKERYLAK